MVAGESAEREYQRRRASRRERIGRSWTRIVVGIVVAFAAGWLVSVVVMSMVLSMVESVATPDGQAFRVHVPPALVSMALGGAFAVKATVLLLAPSPAEVAWRKGAEGERVVARALDALSDEVHVLHDRRIPGSRANLDHVVVTPSGVFTIDAKRYTGRLEVRARGRELWIKGRNRSKLLDQARGQAETVRSVLARASIDHVPVSPVLCFVDTEMPWLFAPKRAGGVLLTTPSKLHRRLLTPQAPDSGSIHLPVIVAALETALVPAAEGKQRHRQLPDSVSQPAGPATTATTRSTVTAAPAPSPPDCGRCGDPMVVRERRSDRRRFYGCSAFPRCHHTQPIG